MILSQILDTVNQLSQGLLENAQLITHQNLMALVVDVIHGILMMTARRMRPNINQEKGDRNVPCLKLGLSSQT